MACGHRRCATCKLSEGRLHVHRVKNGISSVHPIRGEEMRALRKLRRDYPTDAHVFVSERGGPITPAHPAHRGGRQDAIPHPPSHASPCLRFKLANDGHDTRALQHYLGTRYSAHGQVHRNGARPLQGLLEGLIPNPIDQNPWAHWRSPMDMMRQGWSTSLFHAAQQWSTRSS